jgi:hypothetical protein
MQKKAQIAVMPTQPPLAETPVVPLDLTLFPGRARQAGNPLLAGFAHFKPWPCDP